MIDISEKEFLDYIERYANEEISMTQIVNELKSDYRTINNRIIEISMRNPELYNKILENHPYLQKSRTDIDFEALMIYVIKQGITVEAATEKFNVSRRTIQRRVNKIKETNEDLYNLFKICVSNDKKLLEDPKIQQRIEKLEYRDVVIGERNEEREKFLLDIEKKYIELISTGMAKDKAAKQMGYSRDYINNCLDELYRLEIEKNVKKTNKQKEFRNNLSDMSQYTNQTAERQVISDLKEPQNTNNNEAR